MARAVATAPLDKATAASSAHVRCRSSTSTFIPSVCLQMAPLVRGAPEASAVSASCSHWARLTTASCLANVLTAFSIMASMRVALFCDSSSLAAAIQTARSAGNALRA
eukprot:scaffold13168_cov42-Attheya_sp.AAC.1